MKNIQRSQLPSTLKTLGKLFPGQGAVGDGGAVGKFSLPANGHPVPKKIPRSQAGNCFYLGFHDVLVDDGTDLKKHRRITVAQFDNVEERLLLPGIGNRGIIIKAIRFNGVRAERLTARQQEEDKECPTKNQ